MNFSNRHVALSLGNKGMAARFRGLSVHVERDRHQCPEITLARADRNLPGPWGIVCPWVTFTWGDYSIPCYFDKEGSFAIGRLWVSWRL